MTLIFLLEVPKCLIIKPSQKLIKLPYSISVDEKELIFKFQSVNKCNCKMEVISRGINIANKFDIILTKFGQVKLRNFKVL